MRHFHLDWDLSTGRINLDPECPGLFPDPASARLDDWLALLHADDRAAYREAIAGLDPAQPTYRLHYRMTGADGRERRFDERGVARFDLQGRLQGRAAVIEEPDPPLPGHATVAPQQAAGAELLQKVLDSSLAGLYVFDFDLGRNVFVSPRYTALTGFTLEDLERLQPDTFLDRFHPDDRAGVLQHWEQMRGAGDAASVEIEYRFRHRDGRWIWFRSSDTVLRRGPDGSALSVVGTFIDISDLKETVTALGLSDSRARDQLAEIEQIYASAPIGLCVLDRELRFVRVNARLAEINGVPVADHIGRRVRDVLPQIAEHFEARLMHVVESGEAALDIEVYGETAAKPGVERIWIESWLPMRDGEGTIVGINIVAREVTDEVALMHKQAEQQGLLQALFDNAAVGIAQVGADGRFLRCNRRLAEITGYSIGELTGLRFQDITHRDDLEADLAQSRRLWSGDIAEFQMEKRYIRKDGSPVWVKLTGSAVRDAEGVPERFVAIIDDISASREQAVRARILAKVVETSSDFIGVAALDGRARYLNPAGCALVGLDESAVPDTRIEDYLLPEDLPFVHGEVLPAVLRDGRWAGDFRFRHFTSGEPIEVHWDVIRIDDPATGRPELFGTVTRDIREQKAQEAALRNANRRKDEFLAVMGHELRNPMAPIRNALDILLLKADRSEPDIDRTLQILDRQASHLGRLLDDLLDISRIERGEIELELQPVSVSSLMREAADDVRAMMGARGHDFGIDLPDDRVQVLGDRVRLLQVLLNLLLNAAYYTPPGGRVHLSCRTGKDSVTIAVSDTGSGLTPELRERLFVPFARGLSAGDGHPGLGLGLAICRQLVELHGGRLDAESAGPGQGSVFSVGLARHTATRDESPPCAGQANSSSGGDTRVLLVEDNADVAEAMSILLNALGWPTRIAGSGAEALALTGDWCPRLALLDVGLPDMDGTELARRLRARYPDTAAMRLVAVTGFGHAEARERALAGGFDQHLTKPVDCATLQRLLAELG